VLGSLDSPQANLKEDTAMNIGEEIKVWEVELAPERLPELEPAPSTPQEVPEEVPA
jgi:hypothetical protein